MSLSHNPTLEEKNSQQIQTLDEKSEKKEKISISLLEKAEKLLAQREEQQSIREALELFRKAATQGDFQALYRLGCVLDDPTIPDNNPKEAITHLQIAATAGHPEACAHLSYIYAEGRTGIPVSLSNALDWMTKAINKEVAATSTNFLFLASIYDRLGQHKEALEAITQAANKNNSFAQLQLWRRYQCGIGVKSDPTEARMWLTKAAKNVSSSDTNIAVKLAKVLLKVNYESVSTEQLTNLFVSDFDTLDSIGTDDAGRRSIDCSMLKPDGLKQPVSLIVPPDHNPENLLQYITECITPSDPLEHPNGIALNVDLIDPVCGLHENTSLALIMPPSEKSVPVLEKREEEKKEDLQRIVIMRSGHHTNNWLATMGDIDQSMPTILKYLNRDWKQDIAEKNSGLEWLPQRLHLSLGKPTFGDVYVGKIGIGCSAWMYVILSTPPPTLRPEIHTVFPVIVAKARKFYLRVKQILEWHNRIEATMISELDYTSDKECKEIVESQCITALTKPKPEFPLFAIDFVSRRNIWEGKGLLEVFLSGIAGWMIRNPQESLKFKAPSKEPSRWLDDLVDSSKEMKEYDDEDKVDQRPRSVVPDISSAKGKTIPWSQYKDLRGIITDEGPLKENRVCYVQGICEKTIQLPGTIWDKNAYMVTIVIDEERQIKLDVWCLKKHMMDGRATITPGDYMTVNAGNVPKPGDLVFANAWIHGTIATGLDPIPTIGSPVIDPEAKRSSHPARIPTESKALISTPSGAPTTTPIMSLDTTDSKKEQGPIAASVQTSGRRSSLLSLTLLSDGRGQPAASSVNEERKNIPSVASISCGRL